MASNKLSGKTYFEKFQSLQRQDATQAQVGKQAVETIRSTNRWRVVEERQNLLKRFTYY